MTIDVETEALNAAEKLRPLIPHLSVGVLVDLVGMGNSPCVLSIASAIDLPPSVCASIAEISEKKAVIELLKNSKTQIPEFSVLRIIQRFGQCFAVLLALEDRRDLTVAVWWEILLARLNLILDCSNPTDQDEGIEPTNKAILALLWASPSRVREAYLEALNENSAITPALIIECLNAHFFEVAVLLLSKVSSISPQTIEQLFTIENRHKILELARTIRIPNIILVDFMNAAENNFIDQGELLRRAA